MNPKISVIVPVYNTGEILRDTLDSIINQSYKDFELILVDDGSKDESPLICDEYAKQDSRVRVIHKKNGGICDARNTGISVAKGEYITFSDHDDLYMQDKLQVQIDLAEKYNADIVNVGYVTSLDDGSKSETKLNIICLDRDNIKDNLFRIADGHIGTIWVKLYRRKAFGDHFKFDKKYTRGHEDINFNYKMMCLANSFVSIDRVLYRHIIRGELSTSAHVHPEVIIGMYDAIINYDIMVKSFFMNNDLLRERKYYVKILMDMLRTLSVYSIKAGYHYHEYAQMLDDIEQNVPSLKAVHFSDTHLAMPKDRLIFMLLKQSKFLSFMFIKLVNQIKK